MRKACKLLLTDYARVCPGSTHHGGRALLSALFCTGRCRSDAEMMAYNLHTQLVGTVCMLQAGLSAFQKAASST